MPDKQKKQRVSGVIWNALGSLMWGVQSFIMLLMVSRFGSMEQVGAFGIAFTTAQLLYIAGCFGASEYQMTDYAEKYPFPAYYRLRLFSGALMLLLGAAISLAFHFSGEKLAYTASLTLLMLLNVFGENYLCLFFQKNRLDLSGSGLFFRTAASLLAFCAVLVATRDILLAILMQILMDSLVVLYYACRTARPFLPDKAQRPEPGVLQMLIRECFPLFISMFLMNLVINMSKYAVEAFMDAAAQGYLNLIFMPMQVINLCSQFLFRPYLNRYSRELAEPTYGGFYRLLGFQCLLVGILTMICCLGAWFFGASILGPIYGKDISAYTPALTMIVLGGGIFALCNLFYYIFVILRKQQTVMRLYLAALAAAVLLSAILVRQAGVFGAAAAFTLSHVLLLAAYLFALRRALKGRN